MYLLFTLCQGLHWALGYMSDQNSQEDPCPSIPWILLKKEVQGTYKKAKLVTPKGDELWRKIKQEREQRECQRCICFLNSVFRDSLKEKVIFEWIHGGGKKVSSSYICKERISGRGIHKC